MSYLKQRLLSRLTIFIGGIYFASVGIVAATEWTVPEDAAEPSYEIIEQAYVVSALVGENSKGTITVRACDDCEVIQLRIVPETKLRKFGAGTTDVRNAKLLTGKSADISYVIESKIVTGILSF